MLAREPSEENVHSPPDHECWCVPPDDISFVQWVRTAFPCIFLHGAMHDVALFLWNGDVTNSDTKPESFQISCWSPVPAIGARSLVPSIAMGLLDRMTILWLRVVVWWEIMDCTSCTCVLQVWRAGRTASAAGAEQASPADAGTGRWGEIASASPWQSCFGRIFP